MKNDDSVYWEKRRISDPHIWLQQNATGISLLQMKKESKVV